MQFPRSAGTIQILILSGSALVIGLLAYPSALGLGNPIDILFSADANTRLFEDYENTTQSDSIPRPAAVAFDSGYLTGRGLKLLDAGANLIYADTWWRANVDGNQESGTIECYFKADSFAYLSGKSYGLILTEVERQGIPARGGAPEFGFFEAAPYFAINAPPDHAELQGNEDVYAGQWYHMAATWGPAGRFLYLNGTAIDTGFRDTFVLAEPFKIGASALDPTARGQAFVGTIDRLRISVGQRTSFPAALSIRIDSPAQNSALTSPFHVTVRATATETRPRRVDLYADTDGQGFNGLSLALNLPESGTYLVAANVPAGAYKLYALARAGTDTAYFYNDWTTTITPSQLNIVDPVDTTATVRIAPGNSDSFQVILLNGGGVSAPPLAARADSIGTGANYILAARLASALDTARIMIWTTETAPGVWLSVRTDTANLLASGLPAQIPASEAGRRALGATALSLEFMTSNGRLIGDTATTRNLDGFIYTIEYQLSATTARAFSDLGFDTMPGSHAFRFYYSDTYGAAWREDTTVTISVVAGAGGGMVVRVAGITRDLPGGLGGPITGLTVRQAEEPGVCVIAAFDPPDWVSAILRAARDEALESGPGRFLVAAYYWFCAFLAGWIV
jgi:hypothetical protein